MRLDGIDHITAITADGQRCLDFYAGILGLAFRARDRDFEAPGSHVLRVGYPGDNPDAILAFIEAPGIGRGRAGNGMAHLLRWTVRHSGALDYWAQRLSAAGIEVHRPEGDGRPRLRFADPEGLAHELVAQPGFTDADSAPGPSPIPEEHAIVGLAQVRAFGRCSVPSADILAGRLGFRVTGRDSYAVGEGRMSAGFAFDHPPPERGRVGAGTIHHVAWASTGSLPAWRQRVIGMGCIATPVIGHGRHRSIYFREPSGVLFEIAASGQGVPAVSEARRRISPKMDPRIHARAPA
jgi:glyoxalase family protein